MASMVLALLKIFQCPSWKVFLLENGDSSAQLSTRASLFSLPCMSTQYRELWSELSQGEGFSICLSYSWESVLLCSHTWPTSYFLHKIHLYLRTEQAQSHIIQTLLWLRWLSSQRREAVRTPAIYSVIKEYKPYDEVQLVRKIICVHGLWPGWKDHLYYQVLSFKEMLIEEILQLLKWILKKYWMKKGKSMMLVRINNSLDNNHTSNGNS